MNLLVIQRLPGEVGFAKMSINSRWLIDGTLKTKCFIYLFLSLLKSNVNLLKLFSRLKF